MQASPMMKKIRELPVLDCFSRIIGLRCGNNDLIYYPSLSIELIRANFMESLPKFWIGFTYELWADIFR